MADARGPWLSDEAKARIRAEEAARLQAQLEEQYRQEVRAELERELAESTAPTDHERPALPMTGARPVDMPADRVRVMTAVDPNRAAAPVRDTIPHQPIFEAAEDVRPSRPSQLSQPLRRSRLWRWALGAVVLGAGLIVLGVVAGGTPEGAAKGEAIELRPSGPAVEVGVFGEEVGDIAGERWERGPDGHIVVTPRAPVMSLEDFAREHAESEGEPRWPIPENPPLEELARRAEEERARPKMEIIPIAPPGGDGEVIIEFPQDPE